MISKYVFAFSTPFRFRSVIVKTKNFQYASLVLIASSFRVTEENLLFETDLSGPPSFV